MTTSNLDQLCRPLKAYQPSVSSIAALGVLSPTLQGVNRLVGTEAHFVPVMQIDKGCEIVGTYTQSSMSTSRSEKLMKRIVDISQSHASILLMDAIRPNVAIGRFAATNLAHLYGRRGQIRLARAAVFEATHSRSLLVSLLALGLLLCGGFGLFVRGTARHHRSLKATAVLRERQLDARTQENRALIDSSVSVVLVLDAKERIAFANEAAATLFQCAREGFEDRPFSAFVRRYPREHTGQAFNAEGLLDSGERLLLDVQSNKWRTAEGTYQTTVLIRDVTEQINSRREIESLHRRYDVALTGSGIGIFEIDLRSGEAVMSETWHKIMGIEGGQAHFDHRRDFMARVHPDDLPALMQADQNCIAGKAPRSVAEYRVRFQEGWRWMYSDAVPSEACDDGIATRLIGTQCDITDVRHARNALEMSEARFRMVLEDAPVGMAVLDEAGAFIGVNGALSRLCGYDADTLMSDMRLAQLLTRKCFVELSHQVRALLRSGDKTTYQHQVQIRTRSGEECWGLFNLSWAFDKNLNQNVYIAQIIDITQQKRIEQIKSEFIATVSHELRTPLTSIKGALGLLEATAIGFMPEGAGRLLEIAQVNTDRLTVLVNNILDLEKISSGEVAFEAHPTPLRALIEDALGQDRHGTSQTDLSRVRVEGDKGILIYADAGRIRQVVVNLISNACKFSDPETDVIVRFGVSDGMACVFVENTGAPIPESFQSQLFDAFTQNDASDTRRHGGTGLGLNIAREIVMRSGGEIGFEQGIGRKTVFWFSCPVAQPEMDPDADEFCASNDAPDANCKVLHIEGDEDFSDVIAEGFDGVADVSSAHSLEQGRTLLKESDWHVIIFDWVLPDGSISELLDLICQQHPQVQIVSLSSDPSFAQDARIDLYLTKSQLGISQIVEQVTQRMHSAQPRLKRGVG